MQLTGTILWRGVHGCVAHTVRDAVGRMLERDSIGLVGAVVGSRCASNGSHTCCPHVLTRMLDTTLRSAESSMCGQMQSVLY